MQVLSKDLRTRQITTIQADKAAMMESIAGLFVSHYNAGSLDKAIDLFADNAVVSFPDSNIIVNGKPSIHKLFKEIGNSREEKIGNGSADLHLLHSPSFYVNERDNAARGQWDTYSYNIMNMEGKYSCEVMLTRLDIWFNIHEDQLLVNSLNWHVMQSWVPVNYDIGPVDPIKSLNNLKVYTGNYPFADAADFKELQILTDLMVFTHYKGSEALFCGNSDDHLRLLGAAECEAFGAEISACFKDLSELEENNGGKYLCVQLHANPIIYSDKQNAEGYFLAEVFGIRGNAFGFKPGEERLCRSLCLLKCTYRRANDRWGISSYEMFPVADLPEKIYEKPSFVFDRMSVKGNSFGYEPVKFESLEEKSSDCYAIENLVNAWVNGVRRGEVQYFINTYMKESGMQYKFDFKSRGLDAPTFDTPESVYERTKGFDASMIIKQPAYHTASTPIISFSPDGNHAKACWIDFGNTNMVLAFGQDPASGSVPYFSSVDKYMHEFDKVDGIWYMTHWYFEPMMSISRYSFDPGINQSKGWCGSSKEGLFQAPYEDFE